MKVTFGDKKLQKLADNERRRIKELGAIRAKLFRQRIDDMEAIDNLEDVTLPGDTLAEKIKEMGISISEFSQKAELPEKCVAAFITGEIPVTDDMAKAFEQVTHIPAYFWIKRQKAYDDCEEKKKGASFFRRIAAL